MSLPSVKLEVEREFRWRGFRFANQVESPPLAAHSAPGLNEWVSARKSYRRKKFPSIDCDVWPELAQLCKKRVGSQKSGGKPAFPTSRLSDLRDYFHVESLSGVDRNLNSDQLEVRKAGLPPLFFHEILL